MLGVHRQLDENIEGTSWEQHKSNTPTLPPPQKKKKHTRAPLIIHVASRHWLQECFLPTRVLCHFWPGLMVGP